MKRNDSHRQALIEVFADFARDRLQALPGSISAAVQGDRVEVVIEGLTCPEERLFVLCREGRELLEKCYKEAFDASRRALESAVEHITQRPVRQSALDLESRSGDAVIVMDLADGEPGALPQAPNRKTAQLMQLNPPRRRIAVIVPAHNECGRLRRVVETVLQWSRSDEVVVVDDGSTDGTGDTVSDLPEVRLVRLDCNQGKAAALRAGVRRTSSPVLLFLDADLTGLGSHHLDDLVEPVARGGADMAVGRFCQGRWRTDMAQRLIGFMSGQRCLRRELFLATDVEAGAGWGIEAALTQEAKQSGATVRWVSLPGVSQVMKEEKIGLVAGQWQRAVMYGQVARALVKYGGHRLRRYWRLAPRYVTSFPATLAALFGWLHLLVGRSSPRT